MSIFPLPLVSTSWFRFSCPVQVTSVHVRAGSVLCLVVHPTERLVGERHANGRTVTVPSAASYGGSGPGASEEDIDVDVHDVPGYVFTCISCDTAFNTSL